MQKFTDIEIQKLKIKSIKGFGKKLEKLNENVNLASLWGIIYVDLFHPFLSSYNIKFARMTRDTIVVFLSDLHNRDSNYSISIQKDTFI